jgi:CHAT domain-containing protein
MDFLNQALQLRRDAALRDGQAATLHALAQIETAAGRFSQAAVLATEAVSIIEDLRSRVFGPDLRSSYLAARQHYCQLLIRILMELDRIAEAFNVSERARARSLLELLSESGKEIRSGVDAKLIDEEERVTRRLSLVSRRLSEEKYALAGAERESAFREIEKLQAERQQNEERIRAASPIYADLIRPDPLDVESVQASVLDDETLLVQFSLGDPNSYAWTVDREGLRSFQIASRRRLEKAARQAHELLRTRPKRTDEAHAAKTDEALSELSELLVEPLAEGLTRRRILIAAEGWLHYVPFGALQKPGSKTPLSAGHEIVYAPSASTIGALRRNRSQGSRRSNGRRLLIVADPVFEIPGAKPQPMTTYIRPLPFSRIEATTIRDLVSPEEAVMALGFDANREQLTGQDLTQYSIIHFATHAFIEDKYPELSRVALSRFRRDGGVTGGVFRLPEIYNLALNADLVVLSACSTAMGREIRGEGVVGMVRAFMYAGARSVLAALWDVDDHGTACLMQYFYRNLLRGGVQPAEALREAQQELAGETRWSRPHFWAGFVLFGDWLQEHRD